MCVRVCVCVRRTENCVVLLSVCTCIPAAVCLCMYLCFCGLVVGRCIHTSSWQAGGLWWDMLCILLHLAVRACMCVCMCVCLCLRDIPLAYRQDSSCFPCVLCLNLNHPTCRPALFFNTSALSFSLSLLPLFGPYSPHLYPAHRAITAHHYHTISVSFHLAR